MKLLARLRILFHLSRTAAEPVRHWHDPRQILADAPIVRSSALSRGEAP